MITSALSAWSGEGAVSSAWSSQSWAKWVNAATDPSVNLPNLLDDAVDPVAHLLGALPRGLTRRAPAGQTLRGAISGRKPPTRHPR